MVVKKKPVTSVAKLNPKEVEKAHAQSAKESRIREGQRQNRERHAAAIEKSKKLAPKVVEQIVKNTEVKVQLASKDDIPIDPDPISAVVVEGLMEYQVKGTHLRLLGMADPTQTPSIDQRRAMAQRLIEVGPFLPRYVKSAEWKVAPKQEPVKKDDPKDFGIDENHHPKETTQEQERGPAVGRTGPVRKMLATKKPALEGGVPLKKICSDVDIDPKDARRALRAAKIDKPGGRWEWLPADVPAIKKILEKAKQELLVAGGDLTKQGG